MSDLSAHYTPTFSGVFKKLSYSNALGLMQKSSFSVRNYKEDNLVLIYTTRGCLFCEQNGVEFTCDEGKYLLLDKRVTHSYYFKPSVPSEIIWMHVNGSVALEIAAQINSLSKLPFVDNNSEIPTIIQACLDMHSTGNADPFEFSMLINRALCVILNDAYERRQKAEYSDDEYTFRTEIDKILYSDDFSKITLDYMCEKMKMNKYYFAHTFKKYYGVSPIKYVNALKLKKSGYLLRSSDVKISAIAQNTDFPHTPTFLQPFAKNSECHPKNTEAI